MKASRITLIFLVMAMITGILTCSSVVMAEETVTETFHREVGDSASNNSTSTLEDMVTGLFERIFGIVGDIIDFIVSVITAPFRAWANVWTGWGESFGSWYGPILATIIVLSVIMIWRFWNFINKKFLKNPQ